MTEPKRPRTVLVCQECGQESPRWLGRCLLPQAALRRGALASGMELLPAAALREAIRLAFA